MILHIHNRQRGIKVHTKIIKDHIKKVMLYLECSHKELSIVFVNNTVMQKLNHTYRQKDRPTNVLAFPQYATYDGEPEAPEILGDIVVALPTAALEAQASNQNLEEYVTYLLIHGLLHLLGYDHEGAAVERQRMAQRERDILAYLREQTINSTLS